MIHTWITLIDPHVDQEKDPHMDHSNPHVDQNDPHTDHNDPHVDRRDPDEISFLQCGKNIKYFMLVCVKYTIFKRSHCILGRMYCKCPIESP